MSEQDPADVTRLIAAQAFRTMREAAESESTVPDEVRQAVAFLRTRADAGDNVARATLVCLRYLNSRLE